MGTRLDELLPHVSSNVSSFVLRPLYVAFLVASIAASKRARDELDRRHKKLCISDN